MGSAGGVGAAVHWAWHLGVEAAGVGGHATSVSVVLVMKLCDMHGVPVDLRFDAMLGAQVVRDGACSQFQGAVGAFHAAAEALRDIGYTGVTVMEIITDANQPGADPDGDIKASHAILADAGWEPLAAR